MLKPSELGLDGRYIKIPEYQTLVKKKIKELKNLKLSAILEALMHAKNGDTIRVDVLSNAEISEIKNYYAEVLGPILVYNNKLFPQGKFTSEVKCYFSSSQTEGLYDFKMLMGNNEFLFSNKQLKGGTNTLKPVDVVNLVEKSVELKKKWSNSKVFKTFQTLADSNVISGPIKAVSMYYSDKASGVSVQDMKSVIAQMVQNDVIIKKPPKSIMSLVNKEPAARENFKNNGYLVGTVVNFIFEKILIEISKNDPDYNQLFLDVTHNNIVFFKFDISSRGVVSYKVSNPKEDAKKAVLRSKQGVERRSSKGKLKLDKLGFQP